MAVQDVVWTNDELLEQNRHRLIKQLRGKLNTFQARYEIASDQVETAIAKGLLKETAEVCEWVIALHTLRILEREG
jgi:hypothetical protein